MNDTHTEIERKFLLAGDPPDLTEAHATLIEQGYLSCDRHREIRLRRADEQCLLTVKDGRGEQRLETEVTLAPDKFAALWPLTKKARICKTRHTLKHHGHLVEIDIYTAPLAPLRVAEVEFPSIEASNAFEKPNFFGEEITGQDEYSNAQLAIHGTPSQGKESVQAGALPFLFKKSGLHLALVTSSSGNRWIVPKGNLEPGMTRQEVALMEAAEEAGVVGTIEPGLRTKCRMDNGSTLHLYPLRASTLLKHWPEADRRKRIVLPVRRALEEINDKALAKSVHRLCDRLVE